ncbi:integrin alpha-3b [Gadus macrocephalus]|uniref:integrin alpha-3b n=1 Tax=Gadus macrocephalus TaxID=80720 RepID=UPI0028CBB10D|nr:integrin alpha-3b [Gadus macrocephalus]
MARSLRWLFFGVLSFSCSTLPCIGFNLDERFPVIKEGKTSGSFFGFSVALHKQTVGSQKYLLLVGAPKEKAENLKNVNETGAVYFCPITTVTTDCSRVDFNSSTQTPLEKDDQSEMVEGMWLGVTVASQKDLPDGRMLACGHRYVKLYPGGSEKQRRMVGKCYVRGNNLTYDPNDLWQNNQYEFCNPAFDKDLEGMCNLGISGGITGTDVYIGSPGSFNWQGNVHITWRNPDPNSAWDSDDKQFGQKKTYNNYMGYSVLQDKKLLSRDDYTLVTGSPRDESKGSVTLASTNNKILPQLLVIPGQQVGSYFGNSLAITDLNNDDWNDLIVGAPFYFDRSKDHGGAVYVYMNENGSFRKEPSMVLKGPVSSAFGFALAAIGDVDQDGFQDFAVGAPFHETGKVYIWMGSNEGITEKYSQVIEGKSVGDGNFKTFGYSLNGGMDMDDNSYPDLLVGSMDDRIALLRTRPVIHLSKEFTVQPKIVDPTKCNNIGKACIRAKVCFSYTLSNGNKGLQKEVVVRYTIEADMDRWKTARVYFRSTKNATYTASISLSSPDQKCQKLELNVITTVRDKLDPVVFELTMALQELKPDAQGLQDLDSFPILSQEQKTTQRAEFHFHKECGSDNNCNSNLQLTAEYAPEGTDEPYPRKDLDQVLQYDSNVKKVVILVEVTNLPGEGKLAEDAHEAMLNISIPKSLSYFGVRFTEGPKGECNSDGQDSVICELGNPLRSNERVKLRLIFQTRDIDLYTREIKSLLQLSTLSQQSDMHPVAVVLLVEISILTSFNIEKPHVQVYSSGEVVGESAMKKSSDVGSLVEYTFNVEVLGPSVGTMGTLAIEFEWPIEVENGKWLLYLTEIVSNMNGASEIHCFPPGDVVNPLKLNLTEESSSRKRSRRQTLVLGDPRTPPAEPPAVATLFSPRKDTVILDCATGTARCVTFTCPLVDMQTEAKVTVRSRVWNSTLLEDYSKVLRVKVKGKATLKLITDKTTIKMKSTTVDFSVDIDPVFDEEAPYEIPLWIFLVAAGAGVVLLGIISLLLWKCGFFKRANQRQMYEAKDQKAEMKIQPSETEKLTEDY